jgi:hypothetical protein
MVNSVRPDLVSNLRRVSKATADYLPTSMEFTT